MTKARRYFQYEVTDVGGSMEGKIAVGDVTLDWWQGRSHTYTIFDLKKGEEMGWYSVKSLGECTPEQYQKLRAAGRDVAVSRGAA